MDRNYKLNINRTAETIVALRKESVDRNKNTPQNKLANMVALRKESVDRNYCCWCPRHSRYWSLSARRAWIEMDGAYIVDSIDYVALRKESVDRNSKSCCLVVRIQGRSPQGEHG